MFFLSNLIHLERNKHDMRWMKKLFCKKKKYNIPVRVVDQESLIILK